MKQPDGKWWNATWNPVTRRTPASEITLHHKWLERPLHWRKPRAVAVCLKVDLFHPDVPFKFIDKVFAVMVECPQHTFFVFTKRPKRRAEYLQSIEELPEARAKHDCPGYSLAPRIGKLAGDIWTNRRNGRPMFDEYGGCGLYDRCRLPIENVWLGASIRDRCL